MSPSTFSPSQEAWWPEVVCRSNGELSLLPVFLSHQWQVVPCPARGKEVSTKHEERGESEATEIPLQVRWETYIMSGRQWANQDTLVFIYLRRSLILSSQHFLTEPAWLTRGEICFLLPLLRHDTYQRNWWCVDPLLNIYLVESRFQFYLEAKLDGLHKAVLFFSPCIEWNYMKNVHVSFALWQCHHS